jgi:hypothetical protein
MKWISSNGIDTLVVLKSVLTMRVILCQDGRYIVKANGRHLKYILKDRDTAIKCAEDAIPKVIKALAQTIGDDIV